MTEKEAICVITNKSCGHCKELIESDSIQDMIKREELSVLDSDDDSVRKIMESLDIDAVPTFIQIQGLDDGFEICKLDDSFEPTGCFEVKRDAGRTE